MNSKKKLIRDSIIVVPFLIFTVVWLVLGLGFQVDFSPAGSYGESMFFNLIFQLSIVGVGAMIYAVSLVVEAVKSCDETTSRKVLNGVITWLITVNLYFLVYLFRVILLCRNSNRLAD
jgi:hypothetical protein